MAFELQATEGDGERRGGRPHSTSPLSRRVPFCRRSVKLPARERERSRRPASFHFQPCCERLRGPITARHDSRNLYQHRGKDPRAVPVSPVRFRASDKLEFDYQRSNEADVERWKGGRECERSIGRKWQIRKCVVRWSVVQQKRHLSRVTEGRQRDRGRFLRCLRVQLYTGFLKNVYIIILVLTVNLSEIQWVTQRIF